MSKLQGSLFGLATLVLVVAATAAFMRPWLPELASDRRALAMHLAREMDVSVHQSREASTTNAAFARVRSGNPRVRLLGLAQWLTSAFRETEESPYGEIQDAHRQIKRTMRVLRESAGVQSPQAA